MTRWRNLSVCLCLLCLATPATASAVLEPGVAHAAAHGPLAKELAAAIERARESSARLVAIGLDVEQRGDLNPIARERLLREVALALARAAPDATARTLIGRFAQRPPAVRVWLREDGHRTAVTWFDVAGAARYTTRRWAERAAEAEASAALTAASVDLVEKFAAGDDAFRRGAVNAVQRAPAERLLALRDPIASALQTDPSFAALALPLALDLGDVALLSSAVGTGDAATVLVALQGIAAALSPADALSVLEAALPRADVGSAAMFEIGRLADREPAAVQTLFASLDDAGLGGSAAAALARLEDPAVALELGRRLSNGASGLPERRALLALRLSDTDAARSAIEGFMRSPESSPVLKQEVAQWRVN